MLVVDDDAGARRWSRAREAGFQRHIAKPFDPDDLVKAIRELV